MKKVFALLCGILLLCAACAPVTPETPEQSADATTAATTTTTSIVTTVTAATTTTVATTATTTATATTATTATPSTTAKPTTCGYISSYPIPFTVDEYRTFLAEVAKNPEHITDTIAKDNFYKPEHFREWFVDKQAHVPLLSGEWSFTDWNRQEDHEVVIEQRGSCLISITNGDYRIYLEHYMYDHEESSIDGWLSTWFKDGVYEITKRRTLTTKDGREVVLVEARKDKDHSDRQVIFINVDGYSWRITEEPVYNTDFVNMELFEDLLRNLSFEKIEL